MVSVDVTQVFIAIPNSIQSIRTRFGKLFPRYGDFAHLHIGGRNT